MIYSPVNTSLINQVDYSILSAALATRNKAKFIQSPNKTLNNFLFSEEGGGGHVMINFLIRNLLSLFFPIFSALPFERHARTSILSTILSPKKSNRRQLFFSWLEGSLFIFQWVFDEAQMFMDNVGKPVSKQQWNYIHSIGEKIKQSLNNIRSGTS